MLLKGSQCCIIEFISTFIRRFIMKELSIRAISGVIYVLLLIGSLYFQTGLIALLALFGIISLMEFSKLIKLKGYAQYIIFIILYTIFWFICLYKPNSFKSDDAINILLVIFHQNKH